MAHPIEPCQLPAAALDDYAEYRRQGGRYDLDVWWDRYKDGCQAGDPMWPPPPPMAGPACRPAPERGDNRRTDAA